MTELLNMDPESSQGNNNMVGGFERFSYHRQPVMVWFKCSILNLIEL